MVEGRIFYRWYKPCLHDGWESTGYSLGGSNQRTIDKNSRIYCKATEYLPSGRLLETTLERCLLTFFSDSPGRLSRHDGMELARRRGNCCLPCHRGRY